MAASAQTLFEITMPSPTPPAVFTVSQLNERAKQLLEISFANVRVEGELSSLARPSSGHWYFSLKDRGAQVRCAMFRSRTAQLTFSPKEGDQVEIRAKVSLYTARGDYQLIVESMKPAGEGALLLAFQQQKQRLAAAGLFNQEHKQPIPKARRLAIITSSTGAALHDILTVLQRRNPSIEVDVYPALVQGQDAPAQLVSALERANRDQRVDVIILGRGGGSLEDLWCFNDEALVRAVFTSRLPVISAVGHEVDFTLCDFVADLRAPTPSAAAELVSDDQSSRYQQLAQLLQRLLRSQRQSLLTASQQLQHLQQRLRHPARQLEQNAQQLDQLEQRLMASWKQQQQHRQWHIQQWHQRLQHQHPQTTLAALGSQNDQLGIRLRHAMQRLLQQRQQQLGSQAQLLNNLSPLNVLGRGYALCQTPDGDVIRDAQQHHAGERVHARLAQGWLECEIITPHPDTDGTST
ncbi:exodeoxyribonuclease VII large subunit [Oceanobacter sp. 4_MG-2023]|uniref:exodeoxyribonuclease VII large subunit n=1 Tax=Oceanobacter sp. 4_MG-2023 TaxID=3062623 RepID=UPI0027334CE0|nr:exodeoxyribonuclease VII large subunit [Oceanobacter sp. 4_MG-2023]MDP2548692.1 exodeoxyribonuclease VII large subunit [Oceanobacter sp. 4_MG-2023]